ncbi:4-hydroxy-tetrahydrodipicolinate reductase [Chloroflexota bacterium]
MKPIKVVVRGADGRMGRETVNALCHQTEIQLVGAVELQVSEDTLALPDDSGTIPLSSDLNSILTDYQPDVLVDFTVGPATMPAVRMVTEKGVNLVIGTTGLTANDLAEIDRLAKAHDVGAVVAPNFTTGAVLMMHLAKIAARYFDYAEIIELHHNMKVDAPSGTALSTAKAMVEARGEPFQSPQQKAETLPSRGEKIDGIALHSVRLPGLMAHQEVLLGGPGQTLSIRHDTIGRECYMPGVILAIKEVVKRKGLVYGLDTLLHL